jgi:hypothetical protein
MSKNINQVFTANPITSNASTDLMYFGQSPYGITNDAAMTYANFSAQFLPSGAQTANLNMAGHNIQFNTAQGFQDSNGNLLMRFTLSASAVNFFAVLNGATGAGPTLRATGSDGTVGMGLQAKGGLFAFSDSTSTNSPVLRLLNAAQTQYIAFQAPASISSNVTWTLPSVDGSANFVFKTNGSGTISWTNGSQIAGTATNDNASAGNIGEFITSNIPFASAISISSSTPTNITSISCTAGDWDICGNVGLTMSAGANPCYGWISTTSATIPDLSLVSEVGLASGNFTTVSMAIPVARFSFSTTTTVYLTGDAVFGSGTAAGYGNIYARRVR